MNSCEAFHDYSTTTQMPWLQSGMFPAWTFPVVFVADGNPFDSFRLKQNTFFSLLFFLNQTHKRNNFFSASPYNCEQCPALDRNPLSADFSPCSLRCFRSWSHFNNNQSQIFNINIKNITNINSKVTSLIKVIKIFLHTWRKKKPVPSPPLNI